MIKNAVRIAVALFVTCALHGCAQQGASTSDSIVQRETLQARLAELVAAYEAEDLSLIEGSVDRSMIGYQRFIDGVRTDLDRHNQIRVLLVDTESTVENAAGVINTGFEKRFVRTSDSAAGLIAGRTTILFRKAGHEWIITGISGDNPFSAPIGTP